MATSYPTLYGPRGELITPDVRKAMGIYPTPYSYNNIGKFRIRANTLVDTEKSVNASSRLQLVNFSRTLFGQMPSLGISSTMKADWAIGDAFEPLYNGTNTAWGEQVCDWLLNEWYPAANVKGFAFDFKTSMLELSKLLDMDGDCLVTFIQSRNGGCKIQFIPTHRIKSRTGATVVGSAFGRYEGFAINDGVVIGNSGEPIGYYITGDTEDDDKIISTRDSFLIYSPFSVFKTRGIPIISSGITTGLNLLDTDEFQQATQKIHAMLSLVEANEAGEAPRGHVTDANFNPDEHCLTPSEIEPPQVEFLDNTIRYVKSGKGKIEAFDSKTPSENSQNYIRRLELRMCGLIGIPHQIIFSPETIAGAAARGVESVVKKTIIARQVLLEKYGKVMLAKAVAVAITNGILPENNQEKWYSKFSFTTPSEFTLDQGYSRDADINDYKMGFISGDIIATKNGYRLADIEKAREQEVNNLLTTIEDVQKKHPSFSITQVQNMFQMMTPNGVAEQKGATSIDNTTVKL